MEFAEKLRMTHKQDHPDYKYQPRRKKARTLAASVVQCGEGVVQPTNIGIGSSATATATATTINARTLSGKVNSMDLTAIRGCKKLVGNKIGKSTTATAAQQLSQTGGTKVKINVNNNNNGDITTNNNSNNAIGSDMFSNEAFMKSFNNACAASLLQQQQQHQQQKQHMSKDINQIGSGCEYLQPMDSPNSTASSLHSASMIINYGSLVEEPPLTPPATPAYTIGSNINCTAKQTNPIALGRPSTSLLLRQLNSTQNTNTVGDTDLLLLNETSSMGNNAELMSACTSAYNEASPSGGMEFLEFSGIEYSTPYAPQTLHDNILPNNRFQNNNQHSQIHVGTYADYNGINDSSLGLSAYNLMPCSSTLKMHNYTTQTDVGGSCGEGIDSKEIDRYIMDHVLPMTENHVQLGNMTKSQIVTTATTTTNGDRTSTRNKLCSPSSNSSSSSSTSPSSSSYSSTSSSTGSSSLASPIYKQMSTHMLHEMQPVLLETNTTTSTIQATTIPSSTNNASTYSAGVGNNNNNENHAATAFVSETHPAAIAANGNNYYYSSLHYASDSIIPSSTTATTPTATVFPNYMQTQHLEEENLCATEQQQQQNHWNNYVSH